MLLGEFRHSLDAKGRVFLPARWREELATGVVVTRGLDTSLVLMTKERFNKRSEQLEQLAHEQRMNRDYLRLFYSGASEEKVDGQGRMSIPPILREYASLTKDVVLVGVADRAEIWDRERWETYRQRVESEIEDIAEKIEF